MNICVISSAKLSYESGSTLYAQNFVDYLEKAGNNVYIICSELPRIINDNVKYILLDIMEHPVIDDYVVSDVKMLDSISKIVRKIVELNSHEIKFDVIHAHYATINSLAAMITKVIIGTPYLISCFGRDVFNGFDNDKRYERMVLETIGYADHVICSNDTVKEKVLSYGLLDNSKIDVLGMPVDTKVFYPKLNYKKKNKDNVINILNVVSCFSDEKGIKTTLNAVELLKLKKYNVKLYILGIDEHPENKNYIEYMNIIKRLEIDDCIIWKGQVANNEVPNWLRETDILVDSRYLGNYSSVILEALAVGKAIIASDVKGNKEFIEDNVNGILYETGNAKDLAKKIEYIIDDNLINYLEQKAKKWFENYINKYSFSEHTDKIIKIYRRVINE